jgi:hypothetical protein
VERCWGDEQRVRCGAEHQAGDVEVALVVAERHEPRGERQRQQEREQQLDAGLSHAYFLQDLAVAAVEALGRRLPADGEVPLVVGVHRFAARAVVHRQRQMAGVLGVVRCGAG